MLASTGTYFTWRIKTTRIGSYFAPISPGLISIKALLRSYRDTVCLIILHHVLHDVIATVAAAASLVLLLEVLAFTRQYEQAPLASELEYALQAVTSTFHK